MRGWTESMALLFLIGTLGLSGPSCQSAKKAPNGSFPDSTSLKRQREEARQILFGASCRKCHDSKLKTAIPAALKIFDLQDKNWSQGMNPDQLRSAQRRVTRAKEFTEAEKNRFREFIQLQLNKSQ